MTRLIIVRHGQSESNLEKTFAGHRNVHLTELGKAQAEMLSLYLKEYKIDKIYASSLIRAIETAKPTAKRLGKEIIVRENLREINGGKWEGMRFDDVENTYKESFSVWLKDIGNAHPDGGESVLDLSKRVFSEIEKIVSENEGKTVMIVSHGTAIRCLSALWHGVSVSDMKEIGWTTNSSVSIADYKNVNEKPKIVLYNYSGFLGEKTSKLPANV